MVGRSQHIVEDAFQQSLVQLPSHSFPLHGYHLSPLRLLMNDEGDAFLADGPIIRLTQMRNPDANLVSLRKPLSLEPIGMAVPPGDPLLLNLVQNYMRALETSGALKALHKKWFENPSWLVQLP